MVALATGAPENKEPLVLILYDPDHPENTDQLSAIISGLNNPKNCRILALAPIDEGNLNKVLQNLANGPCAAIIFSPGDFSKLTIDRMIAFSDDVFRRFEDSKWTPRLYAFTAQKEIKEHLSNTDIAFIPSESDPLIFSDRLKDAIRMARDSDQPPGGSATLSPPPPPSAGPNAPIGVATRPPTRPASGAASIPTLVPVG